MRLQLISLDGLKVRLFGVLTVTLSFSIEIGGDMNAKNALPPKGKG